MTCGPRTALAAALLTGAISMGLAAVAPMPAGAAARLGARSVAVSTPTGSAVIRRSPFQITFLDAHGRTLLREVRATRRTLRLGAPPTPLAPLYGPPLQETLYAPLEFTVGTERDTARSSGTWAGNLLSSVRTGTVFAARRVRSARRAGAGLRLVVSTSDPSGRVLIVKIVPTAGSLRVSVQPSPSTGVIGIGDSFASAPAEAFHGFGGRHLGLDQRGASFYNWTAEENVNAGSFKVPGAGEGTLLYPNGSQAAYYPQTSFISSRRYGFLLNGPELARFRLDDHRPAWQADLASHRLDYVVVPGDAPRAITALTAITGRQRVPPAWAVGPELDRETQLGASPRSYLAQVRRDLIDIRRYQLPLRTYRLEGWATLPTSTIRSLIAQLHSMGLHALLYFRPFVSQDAAGTEAPGVFQYAVEHRLLARTHTGAPYLFGDSFGGNAGLIDFTNPAALSWWADRVRRALDLGADGFMQDFGEQTLPGMLFHSGADGLTMHNRYPVLYARVTRQVLDRYAQQHPRRKLFFFTRAGYSGTPGATAYENANFAGDETTDWTRSSGLGSVIPDMLNRAVGGAYGYTTDIGGYFDIYTAHATTKELLLRWAELAVFTPFFRLHGSLIAGTHTPWRYDGQTVQIYNRLSRLHQRAVPLILRLWKQAVDTGIPPTRPLWLASPDDRQAARQDQEWLLGENLLVAPVVTQGVAGRKVYFPVGCWRSPASGEVVHGPGARWVRAQIGDLPYFARCGTPAP